MFTRGASNPRNVPELDPYGKQQKLHALVGETDDVLTVTARTRLPADRTHDVAVLCDALERVADPSALLEHVRDVLNPGGHIVACVPNVAHGARRLALLQGRVPAAGGSADRTAFTKESLAALLIAAGYEAVAWERTELPLFLDDPGVPAVRPQDFPNDVIERVVHDDESSTLEFLVKAKPVDAERTNALLVRELEETRAQLAIRRDQEAAFERERAALASELAQTRDEAKNLTAQLALAAETGARLEDDLAAMAQTAAGAAERVPLLQAEIADLSRRLHEAGLALRDEYDAREALEVAVDAMTRKLAEAELRPKPV